MKQLVRVAADSTADLPAEWRAKWDIANLPCYVVFGTESFLDDGSLTPEQFYKRLHDSKELPGTSSAPAALAEEILRKHLEDAEQVVVYTVAQQLSSVYNSIRLAAQNVDPERVTVIDSGTLSMALGWQALAAAEVAAQGGSKAEVIAAGNSARDRGHLYAAIDTLEYLRRGGRVSAVMAGLGTILQIKPIIEVREGQVMTASRVRTMGKGIQALIDYVRKNAPLDRIALMHSNAPALAEQLKAQLADVLPTGSQDNVMIGEVTTAIGTHVGPGCAGVIFVSKA